MHRFSVTLVIVFLLSNKASPEEITCSKYDFEEKVLEKLIKLEIRVEQELQRSRDETNILATAVTGLSDSVAKLQGEQLENRKALDALLEAIKATESNISEHQSMLEKFASQGTKENTPIIFVTHSPSTTSLTKDAPILYKTIVVNEGDGYSSSTGKFTAPLVGVYIFSAQMCATNGVQYQIVINGVPYSSSLEYSIADGVCSGVSTAALLEQGDLVWVRSLLNGSTVVNEEKSKPTWNMFTGALVR